MDLKQRLGPLQAQLDHRLLLTELRDLLGTRIDWPRLRPSPLWLEASPASFLELALPNGKMGRVQALPAQNRAYCATLPGGPCLAYFLENSLLVLCRETTPLAFAKTSVSLTGRTLAGGFINSFLVALCTKLPDRDCPI